MNAVQMAAKMYACRDAARSLLGAHYARDMDLWGKVIKKVAAQFGCSELVAANDMAREVDGFGAIVVLAAYVEMTEPSEPDSAAAEVPRDQQARSASSVQDQPKADGAAAQDAAQAQDAARYRWLRTEIDGDNWSLVYDDCERDLLSGEALDAAIDAAMKEGR